MAVQREDDDDQVDQSKTGLSINVAPELLERIKEAAARQNLSLQEYVRHVLERSVSSEANIDEVESEQNSGRLNRAAVDRLLRYHEELKRTQPGVVFEDSTRIAPSSKRGTDKGIGTAMRDVVVDVSVTLKWVLLLLPCYYDSESGHRGH